MTEMGHNCYMIEPFGIFSYGIDIKEMLAGASLMDEANRTTVVRDNPTTLLALSWYWASGGVGSKDMVVLPYKDSLLLFSTYLQQLVMESLGKEFDLEAVEECS
ncbi:glucose-6-phosphate isomerase 1, chloroplastic-like isoform X3 [Camellia sinensis]|uniref:glucose-6-phosphate isomerase 1, chloroplastic-like isoform X3 n=1 Tax=Camellia sinensis TaxID=4442 RepID=UPI0010363E03|nr:glucose-6-phosphate isomerase 1, chloroplastic-like isoform X3 [Camellia sinensis]